MLKELRDEGFLKDVTLNIEGVKIPAHRIVLASACEYFRSMFRSNMKERAAEEIKIQGIDASVGKIMVDYMYTSKLPLTAANAESVLAASNLLLLEKAKKKAEEIPL